MRPEALDFPATHRNREVIADVLADVYDPEAPLRMLEVASGSGTLVIPGIIPGFDTRGRHYFIPRFLSPDDRSTGTLEALSRVALRHVDPRFPAVTITSFNEWHEGTQVEPDATGDRSAGDTLRQLFKSPAR